MLTVWSVFTGDKYDIAYLRNLREMVGDNLTVPHRFACITDRPLGQVTGMGVWPCCPMFRRHGWWNKLGLFFTAEGPSMYFDLDTLVVKNIDYLVEYTEHEFAAPANWAQSGHGGIQSSVMCWNGEWREPYIKGVQNFDDIRQRLWGDQEFITELRGDNFVKLPHVGSYKYHARQSLPDDLAVVCFHGKPDPHEVGGWTLRYTSTLHSNIRSNTVAS